VSGTEGETREGGEGGGEGGEKNSQEGERKMGVEGLLEKEREGEKGRGGGGVGGDQRRRVEGNAIPYKGLTIAGNGPALVQGDALCGRARRAGSASGVDCHGVAAADVHVVAITSRRVAAEGRRVEVEDVGASAVKVDTSSLEREEREERGGSRGGGVS